MALATFKVGVTIDGMDRVEYTGELIKRAKPKWMPKRVYKYFIGLVLGLIITEESLTDEEKCRLKERFNL